MSRHPVLRALPPALTLSVALWAPTAPGAEPTGVLGRTVWETVQRGGSVMYIILALSIIGQTLATTSATMSLLLPGPSTGRERSAVAMTPARLPSSLPMLSSAFTPPCIPMMTRRPPEPSASTLRSR